MFTLQIIIWAVGIIPSYIFVKWGKKQIMKPYELSWTRGDRIMAITVSLFSWFAVFGFGVATIFMKLANSKKPASW